MTAPHSHPHLPSPADPGSVREERREARDEVEEVAAGILRLQLPIDFPGLGHVNCYAMEDSKGVVLIDPGLPGPRSRRALKKKLDSIGLPLERVHTVVVTHSHPDHFGQAAYLKRHIGADVLTHRAFRTFLDPTAEADDEEAVTVLDQSVGLPSPERQASTIDGRPKSLDGPLIDSTPWGGKPYEMPFRRRLKYRLMRRAAGRFIATPSPTVKVEDADIIRLGNREWISVHTPGHTIDHLCLWDPTDGVMITGDHVLPTITPHISGLGATVDPLEDFFRSLDRMATFDGVRTVLPAHGLDFVDLAGRAQSIKDHHAERLDKLRESSDHLGSGTVSEYMKELFLERSWGPMAESETYAHLEHLKFLGEAHVRVDDHQLRYEFN